MTRKELFEEHKATKTVFQRKNGVLRVLKIPVEKLDPYSTDTKPMFPITKDRDAPVT